MAIGRGTVPQEFFDTTSAMLLKAAEPQFFYAQLLKMSMNSGLENTLEMGTRTAAIGMSGANYSTLDQMQLQLEDPIFTEAFTMVPELGMGPGHVVRVNRPVFTNTTYTKASRAIANGATITRTGVDVSSEQVAITLERFAGPYDSTNSRVAPLVIDEFDARLSVHKLAQLRGLQLKRDNEKFHDYVITTLIDLCASTNIFWPAGFTSDDSALAAGDGPLDWETMVRAGATLDTANIPRFANGRRMAVLHPRQIQQLQGDSSFVNQAKENPPTNPVLMQNYFKSIGGWDIFQSSTLTTATNSNSVTMYYGQILAPGCIGGGFGMLPEVRSSLDDNYGTQSAVIWLEHLGIGLLDNRFVGRFSTS